MISNALVLMELLELDRQRRARVADSSAALRAGSNRRRATKLFRRQRRTAATRQPASTGAAVPAGSTTR